MHVSTEYVQFCQNHTAQHWLTRAGQLPLSARSGRTWLTRGFVAFWLITLVTASASLAQTKYTADFSTSPTFDYEGGQTYYKTKLTVTIGGVNYLIHNAINADFTWTGSAISYNPYSGVGLLIEREDKQPFNFFGIDLNYTSVNTDLAHAPWLTVTYQGSSGTAAPTDSYNETSKNFSVSKPSGVTVKYVQLFFADVATLVLDNLIVGPSKTSTAVAPTVTTSAPTSVQINSAVLGGNVTADGGATVTERGVVYSSTNTTPTTSTTKTAIGSGTGMFSQTISGLSSSTTYYARAYAINSAGTSYGSVQTFTTPVPAPAFTRQPVATTACVGNTATFTVTATGAASFQWQQSTSADFTNSMTVTSGITSTGTSSTLSVTTSASLNGTYFRAVATNGGGTTNSNTAQLTVFTVTAPRVQNVTYCQGTMAGPLTATAASGNSLKWYTSNGSVLPGAPTPSTALTTSTTYYVSQINATGCESSRAGLTVTINSTPTVSISPSTTAICAGQSTILTASGANTYQWNTNQASASISASATGVFSVTGTTTSSGCSATATSSVTVKAALAAPNLQASALITNQPISVTASGCSGMLNWMPQGGTGSASGNVYTFTTPGNYSLSASCSFDGCSSAYSSPLVLQILPADFAITSVNMINCQLLNQASGQYQVSFTPQYSGQNSNPISFSVVNEKSPTADLPPYTLRLYTDNPVITLVADQSGNPEARYRFEWLAACQAGSSPNHRPTTSGIPNQTLLQNQPYQLQLTNYFSDPDGQQLTFTQSGLPAGLSITGSVISGSPISTGSGSVKITALDPGGLSVQTTFQLTINAAPTTPTNFTITGVSTVSCEVISAGERRLTFNPQYAGQSSSPISFSVVNEKSTTTDPGPYSLNLYTDNPAVTLSAQQGNSVATYRYNWLTVCNANSRLGVTEAGTGLQVRVLGNPVEGRSAEIEISGVAGQSLQLNLIDLQGRLLHQQRISEAGSLERVSMPIGTGRGLLLLQVSTATERQQVKLLKK